MKKFLFTVLKFIGLFVLAFILGLLYVLFFTSFPDYSFMWYVAGTCNVLFIGCGLYLGIECIINFFVKVIKKLFSR